MRWYREQQAANGKAGSPHALQETQSRHVTFPLRRVIGQKILSFHEEKGMHMDLPGLSNLYL